MLLFSRRRSEKWGRACLAAALFAAMSIPVGAEVLASVSRRSNVDVTAAAARIDQLVVAGLHKTKQRPNPLTDDATFVRRVHLDLIGRVPSYDEVTAFLASNDRHKRAKLIDKLVTSPGYNSHMFNYWADILRVKTRANGGYTAQPYIDWIKKAVAENKHYDDFVFELLASRGSITKEGEGATGYYLRDRGMPLDNMSNTVRVFLGTRLECAQCHDHPFDKWKQMDFYKMAAFTGGIRYDDEEFRSSQLGKELGTMYRDLKKKGDDRTRQNLNRMVRPLRYGVAGTGTGVTRLPKDYQYDDAKPSQYVKAAPMFGDKVNINVKLPGEVKAPPVKKKGRSRKPAKFKPTNVDSRKSYAKWMTSPTNPRFTTVIVNRLWKRAMGLGLIEPIDDMRDDNVGVNPPLSRYLERLMVEVDYDIRAFQRVLHNTKTYQRQANLKEPLPGKNYYFPGPLLRRMTGEQIWDSMLTLVQPKIDEAMAALPYELTARRYSYDVFDIMRKTDATKLLEIARSGKRGGQAMMMMMSMSGQSKAKKPSPMEMRKRLLTDLGKQRKRALKAKDRKKLAEIGRKAQAVYKKYPINKGITMLSQSGLRTNMLRASEMTSPSSPGHFLRQFGQSDREVISGANQDATVPQVLALLNGFVEQSILGNTRSELTKRLLAESSPEKQVRVAYLSILNRQPTRDDMKMFLSDIQARGKKATDDMVWTLLNANEFMFVR